MSSKTATLDLPQSGEKKYRPAIKSLIAEIDLILKGNKRKDAEIEKSKRRMRAKLDVLNVLMR